MTEEEFQRFCGLQYAQQHEEKSQVQADIALQLTIANEQLTRIANALQPQTITSVFADKLTPDQREILENKVREFKNPEGGD